MGELMGSRPDMVSPRAGAAKGLAADASPVILFDMDRRRFRPDGLPIPSWGNSKFIISPPTGAVPGTWIGAPRGALWDEKDSMVMALRFRQPVGMGRGGAIVLVESFDGEHFNMDEPLQVLTKKQIFDPRFDREEPASLELASIVRTPEGKWRLYICLGEADGKRVKQWHIRMMEADAPTEFDTRRQIPVLEGNNARAVKDPSVKVVNGKWFMAVACHINPLSDPANADRMYAGVSMSDDGIYWPEPENVFQGQTGTKFERGVRITEFQVNPDTNEIKEAFIDGRPDAAHNWFEHTYHIARDRQTGLLTATTLDPILVSPHPAYSPDGVQVLGINNAAARYACVVPWPERGIEIAYFEATGPKGINGVRAEVFPIAA